MEDEETIGAAGTSYADLLGMSQGALNRLGGKDLMEDAIEIAREISPEYKPIDPALLAFQFFTNMAAEASKPGQTALGAASTASLVPAQYLMKDAMAKREAEAKLPATAINIAKAIKPPKATGSSTIKTYELQKDIPGLGKAGDRLTLTNPDAAALAQMDPASIIIAPTTARSNVKAIGSGSQAIYMPEDEAKAYVSSLGLPEKSDRYDYFVDYLTAQDDEQIGMPVIKGDSYIALVPQVTNGVVTNLLQSPVQGSTPPFVGYRKKRLETLAKSQDGFIDKRNAVIPRVEGLMEMIRLGRVPTGGFQDATLGLRSFLVDVFNADAPFVANQQTLQAASNFLAPKMRPIGSGSTSDMEFKAYQRAIVDLGNTELANYISLYTFKRSAELGVLLNDIERDALTSGKYSSTAAIGKKMREVDPGIFEKYTGDPDNAAELRAWWDSLPSGAVAVNTGWLRDGSGSFLDDYYVVKDWQGD